MPDREMKIIVSGDEKGLEAALSRASQAVDAANAKWKRQFGALADISGKVSGALSGIGVAGLAAAGLLAKAGLQFADEVEQLDNLSAKTQLSTQRLQEMGAVARAGGLNMESLARGVTMFEAKLNGAEDGTGSASDALQELGVSVKGAGGELRTMDELFPEVVKKLQAIENGTKRNALAAAIFGKGWQELAPILDMGAGAFDKLVAQAHAAGAVMSEELLQKGRDLDATIDALTLQLVGLRNEGLAAIVPVVQGTLVPALQALLPVLQDIGKYFASLSDEQKASAGKWILYGGAALAAGTQLATFIGFVAKTILYLKLQRLAHVEATKAALEQAGAETAAGTAMQGAGAKAGTLAGTLGKVGGWAAAVAVAVGLATAAWEAYNDRQGRALDAQAGKLQATIDAQKSAATEIQTLGTSYDSLSAKVTKTADEQAQLVKVKYQLAASMERISQQLGIQIPQVGELSEQWKAYYKTLNEYQAKQNQADLLQAQSEEQHLRAKYRTQYTAKAMAYTATHWNSTPESRAAALKEDPDLKAISADIEASQAKQAALKAAMLAGTSGSAAQDQVGAMASGADTFLPPEETASDGAVARYRLRAEAARAVRGIEDDIRRLQRQQAEATEEAERARLAGEIRVQQQKLVDARELLGIQEKQLADRIAMERDYTQRIAVAKAAVDAAGDDRAKKTAAQRALNNLQIEFREKTALQDAARDNELKNAEYVQGERLKDIDEANAARLKGIGAEQAAAQALDTARFGNADYASGWRAAMAQMQANLARIPAGPVGALPAAALPPANLGAPPLGLLTPPRAATAQVIVVKAVTDKSQYFETAVDARVQTTLGREARDLNLL